MRLAMEEYTKALELQPEDVGLLFNFGRALFDSGDKQKAKEYFGKCLKLDPSLKEAAEYLEKML